MTIPSRFARALVLSLSLMAWANACRADDVFDFFKSRTVNIVVGHETGTGFDLYGRLMARHLGRHIPGSPAVVVQNMPGGGGLNAAQWLYNVAPKDGTTLAIFAHTAPFEPLLGDARAKLDGARFTWIGNLEVTTPVCAVTRSSGVTTAQEFLSREVLVGSSGGPLGIFPTTLRKLLGAKLKLVMGYKGSADIKLAMQRDEVQAICGNSISSMKSQWTDDLDSGRIRIIMQFGRSPHPELPGVAFIYDFATTPAERQLFGLIYGSTSLGRALSAPPDLPPARTKALREAFRAMIADPEMIADAAKSRLDLSPASGEEVEALVRSLYASPPEVVDRARAMSRIE